MNPLYPGVRPPSIDFQAVRDGRRSRPLYFQCNLDTARSIANGITEDVTDVSGKALLLKVAGNSWWSDPIYDSGGFYIAGIAVAHFEDSALGSGISTPITVLPNSAQRIPFTFVIIENFAQAGKKLRVVYGVDLDFVPGFNAQVTLQNNGFPGDDTTTANGAFFGGFLVAAQPAQFAQVALWNPVGSGKVGYCDLMNVYQTGAAPSGPNLKRITTAPPGGDTGRHQNRNLAVTTAPGCRIFIDQNAAGGGSFLEAPDDTSRSGNRLWPLNPAVRIPEGTGLAVQAGNVAINVAAAFWWREKTS